MADVDFFVSKDSMNQFTIAKVRILEHLIGQGPNITSIDILHDLYDQFQQIDFQSLKSYVEVLEGISVLKLEVLLCAKFTCLSFWMLKVRGEFRVKYSKTSSFRTEIPSRASM